MPTAVSLARSGGRGPPKVLTDRLGSAVGEMSLACCNLKLFLAKKSTLLHFSCVAFICFECLINYRFVTKYEIGLCD